MTQAQPRSPYPEASEIPFAAIGQRILPIIEPLAASLPAITAIMVSTADGFNLCALGLTPENVERVSALGSALHSVASTVAEAIASAEESPLDLLTIVNGSFTTVVFNISLDDGNELLLWVTTGGATMGSVIFGAREAAAAIRTTLLGGLSVSSNSDDTNEA